MTYNEFIKNINIKYDNWDDFGHKCTARISFVDDNQMVLFNIYPNSEKIYNKIMNGEKPQGDFFVLGGQMYYDLINEKIPKKTERKKWFELTNDLAYNTKLLDKYLKNYSFSIKNILEKSFMRFSSYTEIKYQFHRMALGGKYLEHFKINIYSKKTNNLILKIDVNPDVDIPENTFGLIGKNGTGKTYILNNLAKLFIGDDSSIYYWDNALDSVKVLHISYSPFDTLEIKNNDFYEKIGLNIKDTRDNNLLSELLIKELKMSVIEIFAPSNQIAKEFWIEILKNFEYEDWISVFLFKIIEADFIADSNQLEDIFRALSSGQKIMLLTLSKLISKVREKTLVLVDEPELFLHPSLAKSYIRAIIQIITRMNGIGVIATHNPLILQELQTECVKITIRKDNNFSFRELKDLGINSYGENANILNNIVFGIDIQNTGYYQYLKSLNINELLSKSEEIRSKLGSEGRVLLNLLIEEKSEKD